MTGVIGVDVTRDCRSRLSRRERDINVNDEVVLDEARRNRSLDYLNKTNEPQRLCVSGAIEVENIYSLRY
jgi:hypothetical protein